MSIERARADLDRLDGEAEALRGKLSSIEAQIAKINIFLEMAKLYGAGPLNADVIVQAPKVGRPVGGGNAGRKVEAAIAAITAARGPIHTRELISKLSAQGIEISGRDPVVNLSSTLSRSEKLKNRRASGWSLKEWPGDFPPEDTTPVPTSEDENDHIDDDIAEAP